MMEFWIADTFTDSLAKLTGEEQKATKTTAFDLQINPANPGLNFHRLEKARDKHFCSIRVNRDLRIIVHKTTSSLMLCYVDHHDSAYRWGEKRKLETHPKTGAAQLVEIRERVKEIMIPKYVEAKEKLIAKPALFAAVADQELLEYGVPTDWLDDVRVVNEDNLLELTDHLPAEASEALLELATGGRPQITKRSEAVTDPFAHPDAQRRFRVMTDVEELTRALDYPWEKWTIFLHPAQRKIVEKEYNGPSRVAGSAGTGKTIVALHRAVYLARSNPDTRVLLTTFSDTLAKALHTKLRRLISNEPMLGERIEVHAIDSVAEHLYGVHIEHPKIVSTKKIRQLIKDAAGKVTALKFTQRFLLSEWEDVVDAWQLNDWEAYRDVKRLGRKTRLPEKQRAVLWSIYEQVKGWLDEQGLVTYSDIFSQLAVTLKERKHPPFEFAIVDEVQDISVAQLRFLAAMCGQRENSLFFAGDLGQRIFQTPFSWKSLGVDIRGRSHTLHINYRTSHQIRMQADRLLGPEVSDVDGNVADRRGTVSVFNGPAPRVEEFDSIEEECAAVAKWIKDLGNEAFSPHEIGVFVRSDNELERARAAVQNSGLAFKVLDENMETTSGFVSISTMHLAKGLEFRAVVVMACDDEVIPSQERIETVADNTDLEEVYDTERHLLYVACTRARDHLLVTSGDMASEFLDDLLRT